MDDAVLWFDRRLCEVRVLKLEFIRKLLMLCIFFNDREGAVVAESGVNVQKVVSMETPVYPCAGIFLYDDMVSNWSIGNGVVIKGDTGVLPR